MPSLNAALGLAQLEKIKIFLKLKRKLYKKYFLYFQDLPGVKVLKERKNNVSNYWLQTIILDKKLKYLKNDILAYCYKKNFLLRPIWKLISDLRPYKKKQKMNLSGSKFMEDHLINLPSSQSLLIKK